MQFERKVEYHDEEGNSLNEEQVKELEGKVSFSTRYETRTKIVDSDGQVLYKSANDAAPLHPDVDQGTRGIPDYEGRDAPPNISPEKDQEKEKSIENAEGGKPKPASEANEATTK